MEALKELLYSFGSFLARMIKTVIDWFMGLSLLNKIIVMNTVTAFFAITLPIAKYYIFETWNGINNPVAVYMILIVFIMCGTTFLHGPMVLAGRIVINLWYFIAVIVIYSTHSISHAPYVLSPGFFFNLAAPVIYMAAAVMVYLEGDN